MKKIGIMSMQRVINYGSFLQAYGLKKIIEKNIDSKVEFIDYEYEGNLINKKKDGILKKIKRNQNLFMYIKKKKYLKKLKENFLNNYLKSLGIDQKNYNKDIDTLVIGSDEVFNCLQGYPVGYSRNLYGKGFEDTNVISYAASFGFTTLNKLKQFNVTSEIGSLLSKFKGISVRDNNSFDIVKELTNIEPSINLDPVLVYDFSVEGKIDYKNYIIVYAYTDRLTKQEEKLILKFAKKHKKQIISIGGFQKIADYNLIIDPLDVFKYFKNADFVITDTFHGTIFSVKTRTKFCTIIRESNKNKLSDLLSKLALQYRTITDLNDIERLYNEDIDFTKTEKILDIERNKTIDYLVKNIR